MKFDESSSILVSSRDHRRIFFIIEQFNFKHFPVKVRLKVKLVLALVKTSSGRVPEIQQKRVQIAEVSRYT